MDIAVYVVQQSIHVISDAINNVRTDRNTTFIFVCNTYGDKNEGGVTCYHELSLTASFTIHFNMLYRGCALGIAVALRSARNGVTCAT